MYIVFCFVVVFGLGGDGVGVVVVVEGDVEGGIFCFYYVVKFYVGCNVRDDYSMCVCFFSVCGDFLVFI